MESDQREGKRVGSETLRSEHRGIRSAMHAPRLRLSLGRWQARVSVSVPFVSFLGRWQGGLRSGPAST